MKKTNLILLVAASTCCVSQAALVTFRDLDNADNDIITAGGDGTGTFTVTRSIVAGTGGLDDYLFAFSYGNTDFDGDTVNDTLTFNVRVSASTGNAVSSTGVPGANENNSNGAVTLNGSEAAASLNGDRFTVGNALFDGSETLTYTVENMDLGSLNGTYVANFEGFKTFRMFETGRGNSHISITGEGTGLFTQDANGNSTVAVPAAHQSTLHVSALGTGGGNNQRYGIDGVGFDIEVLVIPEPSSTALLGLGALGLLGRRRR